MSEEINNLFERLKTDYDSGQGDDLGNDFFTPCLKYCTEYLRTTSDFTSNVIFDWGEAVVRLVDIENENCKIKMIAHHKLHDDDKQVLREFVDNQHRIDEHLEKLSEGIFDEAFKIAEGHADKKVKLKLFAYLVASERLELQFAFPHHVKHSNVFHQKYGIYKFPDNKKIGFIGSANETLGGHSRNIETIEVFKSPVPHELKRINTWENRFEESWSDNAKGFRTKSLSKKTLDRIQSYTPGNIKQLIDENKQIKKDILSGNGKDEKVQEVWPHKKNAIEEFLKKKNGVLEMATGTGKTKTSLEILKVLVNENKVNSCIIATDGNSLLDQWRQEILKFHSQIKIKIKKVFKHFDQYRESAKYLANPNNSLLLTSRENLRNFLPYLNNNYKKNIFIIHDEVHALGSPANIKNLNGQHKDFIYKLGMSATPEREYGEEGNKFISNELGEVFFRFSLEDAIRAKVLCKMDYVTREYFLSDDESKLINKLIRTHKAKKQAREKVDDKDLYTAIAAVRKNAENKIKIFADYVKYDPTSIKNSIIFVFTKERGRRISQILQGKVKYREYFEGEVGEHLINFAKGKLDCLITCHRLSQGIDIHGLKNVFLIASDRSRLETIQRIGRCLRKNPKDPFKKARVVDFIDNEYDADEKRSKWLNELANIK